MAKAEPEPKMHRDCRGRGAIAAIIGKTIDPGGTVGTKSFFSNMRGQLCEYGKPDALGRYLALCLQEALRENRKLLRALFPELKSASVLEVAKEYRYSDETRRRADLAVLNAESEVLGLIEVKVADSLTKAQGTAYRDFVKVTRCPLLFITRFPLSPAERDYLAGCQYRELSTNDLCRIADSMSVGSFPVTTLLGRYLQENEMVYTRYIDDSLALLVSRVCVGRDKNVMVSLADITGNLPDAAGSLFATLQHVGSAVRNRLQFSNGHQRKWTNVSLNLEFRPKTSVASLEALVKKANKEQWDEVWLSGLKKDRWGTGSFWASLQVSDTTDQTYLAFGVEMDVAKGKPAKVRLVSWVAYDPDQVSERTARTVKLLPKRGAWDLGPEQAMIEAVVKALRESKNAYVEHYAARDPKEYPAQAKRVRILRKVKVG